MSYEFYKVIHLVSIVFLFSGLMVLLSAKMISNTIPKNIRMLGFISHGIGILLILVSGFGLLARLQIMSPFPIWAYAKIAIWLLLALAASVLKRRNQVGMPAFVSLITIFIIAAVLAIYKPF